MKGHEKHKMLLQCHLLCMFNNIVAVNKIAVPTTTKTVQQKTPTLQYSNPSNPGTPQLYWPTGPPPWYSTLSVQTSSASLQHTPWYNFQILKNLQKHIHLSPGPLKCSVLVPGVLPKPQIASVLACSSFLLVFPGLNNTPNTM